MGMTNRSTVLSNIQNRANNQSQGKRRKKGRKRGDGAVKSGGTDGNASDNEDYSDVESEKKEEYRKGGYHPVSLATYMGPNRRFFITEKLGWGYFSTVWMAYDCEKAGFVAIKIQKSAMNFRQAALDEIELLQRIVQTSGANNREAAENVIQIRDFFEVSGQNGRHICMVFDVMGENLLSLIKRSNYRGLPLSLVALLSASLLRGLDFLHSKAKIIHTDIKPENIFIRKPSGLLRTRMRQFKEQFKASGSAAGAGGSGDGGVETQQGKQGAKKQKKKKGKKATNEQQPLEQESNPTPEFHQDNPQEQPEQEPQPAEEQKQQGQPSEDQLVDQQQLQSSSSNQQQQSDPLPMHSNGQTLLAVPHEELSTQSDISYYENISDFQCAIGDFGNAIMRTSATQTLTASGDDISTRQYRAPEIILGGKYSYPIDIWSMACLIFELATGDFLFEPRVSKNWSRDEDHLALMIELLGKPPKKVIFNGKNAHKFLEGVYDSEKNCEDYRLKKIRNLKFWALDSVLNEKYAIPQDTAALFADFLLSMLRFDPEKRATAEQMLSHPFLRLADGMQSALFREFGHIFLDEPQHQEHNSPPISTSTHQTQEDPQCDTNQNNRDDDTQHDSREPNSTISSSSSSSL